MNINPIAQAITIPTEELPEVENEPTCYMEMPSIDDFHKPQEHSAFSPIWVDIIHPLNWVYVKLNLTLDALEKCFSPVTDVLISRKKKKQDILDKKAQIKKTVLSYGPNFRKFNNELTFNERHPDGSRVRDIIRCKTNRNIKLK